MKCMEDSSILFMIVQVKEGSLVLDPFVGTGTVYIFTVS